MTVKELILELKEYDENLPVCIESNETDVGNNASELKLKSYHDEKYVQICADSKFGTTQGEQK